jgi:hypothetical protein
MQVNPHAKSRSLYIKLRKQLKMGAWAHQNRM